MLDLRGASCGNVLKGGVRRREGRNPAKKTGLKRDSRQIGQDPRHIITPWNLSDLSLGDLSQSKRGQREGGGAHISLEVPGHSQPDLLMSLTMPLLTLKTVFLSYSLLSPKQASWIALYSASSVLS